MPVENVHEAKRISETDPKAVAEKTPQDLVAVQTEVAKTRARRELVQEQQLTESILNPPAQEPPFKVSGGINLGNIDIQEQQREARADAQKERAASEIRLKELEQERDRVKDELNSTRMMHLKGDLTTQIDSLKLAIQNGGKHDFFSELEGIESIAAKLGFRKEAPGDNDMNANIALKRLEMEMKSMDRKFALEMKKDDRLWQVEIKKLDAQALESQQKLAAEKQKYAMLANIPTQVGSALAKGLMARGGEVTSKPAEARPAPIEIFANEGEAGELSCPVCKTQVGIGPTSKTTMCAKCSQPFVIKREATAEV